LIKHLTPSLTAIVIVLITAEMFASPVLADQANAQTAIASAKNNIKSCYDAAKEAEAAGANIDSLVATLNNAAGLLSESELAYASNDYNSAYNYATQSQSKLDGFIPQATIAKENAMNQANQSSWNVLLSIIISASILCAGIAGWIVLDRIERKKASGSATI